MDAGNDASKTSDARALPNSATDHGPESPLEGTTWTELRNRLLRLAFRFLWNRDEAEDAVQDAITRALAGSSRLRDRTRAWPWLCRVVVRRCYELGRKKQRRRRLDEQLPYEFLASRNPDESGLSDSAQRLPGLIAELPRRQREVLVLRHVQAMSFDEISNVLGISASTARVHAIAARETLRRLLVRKSLDFAGEQRSESGE